MIGNNNNNNPLQLNNSKLNAQLREVADITTFRGFQVWRRSFLAELEPFLDADRIQTAASAYQSFGDRMTHLMTLIVELETIHQRQKHQVKYSHEHCLASVQARRCLTEINKELCLDAGVLESLLPSSSQQEQTSGYTKLHMGTIFLQDDFKQYSRLLDCQERLMRFHAKWGHVVLDDHMHKAIELFRNQFQSFCDIMAGLGLCVVMKKCHELLQVVEKPDVIDCSERTMDDGDNDDEDNESMFHCSFCKMAAMDDSFHSSMFCYESSSSKRASRVSSATTNTKPAFDGDNSSRSLTTNDLAKSPPLYLTKKKNKVLATSGIESSTTAATLSVLELSLDSFDAMDRSSNNNNRSFKTTKESGYCHDEVLGVVNMVASHRQKFQQQKEPESTTTTTCGSHTTGSKTSIPASPKTSQEPSHDTNNNHTVSVHNNNNNSTNKKKQEWLRKVYRWYARMGQPDRETMKKRIAKVQPDISSDDIDKLPWMPNGTRVDVVQMHAMCLK